MLVLLKKMFQELEVEDETLLPPGTRVTVEMGPEETGKWMVGGTVAKVTVGNGCFGQGGDS